MEAAFSKKKTSKRARKFNAKGGIKAKLKNGGTVTRKGRNVYKSRKGFEKKPGDAEAEAAKRRTDGDADNEGDSETDDEGDFLGPRAVGDMDMEDFMRSVGEGVEEEEEEEEEEEMEEEEEEDDRADESLPPGSDSEPELESDGGGSSDEDDDPAAAAERHERQMKNLAKKDPDFYKYLAESDAGLLQFQAAGDDEDAVMTDDTAVDATDPAVEGDADADADPDAAPSLTMPVLRSLERSAFSPKIRSLRSLRKIVRAYADACHASVGEEDGTGEHRRRSRFVVRDSAVYNRLLVVVLKRSAGEFLHHILGAETAKGGEGEREKGGEREEGGEEEHMRPFCTQAQLATSEKWGDVRGSLDMFLRATVHLLTCVRDKDLLTFVLRSMIKYVPMFLPFPKAAKNFLKVLVTLYSAPHQSEDDNVVRLQAFLRIRQLAVTQPFPFIEACLKAVYLAYARRAKFVSEATLPTLTFMGNCVVEIYCLDPNAGYRHAFVYVRQLALYLRTALQKRTKESFQAVHCWQYVNCLYLWTAVLAAAPPGSSADGLSSLVYPLAEIINGAARLLPTARHVPLRLHCVRCLQSLAASSRSFVPAAPLLLETLDLRELALRPKKTNRAQPVRLRTLVKLPKEDTLRTPEQREAAVGDVFLLLGREAELYRHSPGFPEYAAVVCQHLRKFCKRPVSDRWRSYARGCVDLCERRADDVVRRRALLTEAPKDVRRLEFLKPAEAPDMQARHAAAVDKERKAEAAAAAVVANAVKPMKKEAKASDVSKNAGRESAGKKGAETKKEQPPKQKEATPENVAAAKKAAETEDIVEAGVDWSEDEGTGSDDDDGAW